MRPWALAPALLLLAPAALAASRVYEFHGDLGPLGWDAASIPIAAGTTRVQAIFHLSASALPAPVATWDVSIELAGSSAGCGLVYPNAFGWNTCTLTLDLPPLAAPETMRLVHSYRGAFHADIVATAE